MSAVDTVDSEIVSSTPSGDPWLLTPGPLTTSLSVKQAMMRDYGSRDSAFIEINAIIRRRLIDIVNGAGTHECVPLQGSGTFVVEAMVGTFVPADGKLLILVNGAYGKRIARICEYYNRTFQILEQPEGTPTSIDELDGVLAGDSTITHVAVVHCETTTGVLNPLEAVAAKVEQHQRRLLIDAMSSFGALPVDAGRIRFDAVVASSNKCLEGAPGMGFCLARKEALEATRGNSPSLSLDLYDQWVALEGNGQWRFTPPTHCILALHQAIREFDDEGGVAGRGRRYRENCKILVDGMRAMGFKTLLSDEHQAPIIVTFYSPGDAKFEFDDFYEHLRGAGYVIYPGKLTAADTFRIGCIGRLGASEIKGALQAVQKTLAKMGITNCAPPKMG